MANSMTATVGSPTNAAKLGAEALRQQALRDKSKPQGDKKPCR